MPGPVKRRPHPVDEVLPAGKLAVYGFQHVLAFYAGAVIVPILLAGAIGLSERDLIHLINADLFTCGIASIIQSVGFWKIGVRLPLLQGVTFTAVSPMIAIGLAAGGGTQGLLVIYGAVIVAGLATFFIAPFFGRLLRFFPPVVTGSVITIIGIALLPVAAADAVGGADNPQPGDPRNLAYALGTLAVIVVMQRLFRGFLATVAVLVGLVLGTLVAWFLGDATFSAVGDSAWFGVTTPFWFGWPQFSVAAILSMVVVMLITAVETTGDVVATGEIVDKRVGGEDVTRALRADGLATTIGGVLNSFPYTCFAENVGLVRLTRVKSRYVVATAGLIMIVIGLLPKAGAIVAGIPHPVLGGAALAMFATVAVVGIQTLSRVDFHDHRNVVIVASSLGLAVFVTVEPDVAQAVPQWAQIVLGSGITIGSLTAIVLNLVFHHLGRHRGPAVAGAPGAGTVRLEQVNAMDRAEFVATFGKLFQGADAVVGRAHDRRPFADTANLRAAFQEALFAAPAEEQRAVMAAYPDLGGPEVADGDAGGESAEDQAAAGLTRLDEADRVELEALVTAYRDRFGIPLIVCVRDAAGREGVLRDGRQRLGNSATQEHAAALIEIAKIANHRFGHLVAEANPIHAARTRSLD
ncbi:2-oxo-4-hydroxy-4-carboxy-5-ureidoimidazoline decarboxylase [Actinomycetospora termitidis]|uniref:2-oxo-4-hydroxy-4-carboxy-5-ureidoimidazoline decarboxylase n=1 Tax=Actinomycetospora termitidis TaxID=3053470 RepID=A0ABT7MCW4_9PSEU|nr:2-oxo-4-hydroxy-4-carboxy-5-ureidoimidazoline decarboxylase [Actinomycetospora sp. Odt1-22]MDL5157682.1 2-oxo-4-hydroxy-4-carboxy-5-ureidoimidazoline decarboxylase [Actinomycetospora sp. Odt1-22]